MVRVLDNCGRCHTCLDDVRNEWGIPITATRMVLCKTCGNKRCPHATDHRHVCTNSNEPGQYGSIYGRKSRIGDWNV